MQQTPTPNATQRELQKIVELKLPIRRHKALMQCTQARDDKIQALTPHRTPSKLTRTRGNLVASTPVARVVEVFTRRSTTTP